MDPLLILELERLKKEIKEINNPKDTYDLSNKMELLKIKNKKLKDDLDKIGNLENGIEDYFTESKNLDIKKRKKYK